MSGMRYRSNLRTSFRSSTCFASSASSSSSEILASPPGGHVPTVSSASDESMAAGERVSNIVAVCVFESEGSRSIKGFATPGTAGGGLKKITEVRQI